MTGTGQIILLNGTSSAGKTTLAHRLHSMGDRPFVHLGIDTLADGMKPGLRGATAAADAGLRFHPPQVDGEQMRITIGPHFDAVVRSMHRALAAIADSGVSVIADHWLWWPGWLADCAQVLGSRPAYLVGVRCPLEVVEAREQARGDRPGGVARAVFDTIHEPGVYDVEVDSSTTPPDESARLVFERMERPPCALERLRRELVEHPTEPQMIPATTRQDER